jgi:hypothetical protein
VAETLGGAAQLVYEYFGRPMPCVAVAAALGGAAQIVYEYFGGPMPRVAVPADALNRHFAGYIRNAAETYSMGTALLSPLAGAGLALEALEWVPERLWYDSFSLASLSTLLVGTTACTGLLGWRHLAEVNNLREREAVVLTRNAYRKALVRQAEAALGGTSSLDIKTLFRIVSSVWPASEGASYLEGAPYLDALLDLSNEKIQKVIAPALQAVDSEASQELVKALAPHKSLLDKEFTVAEALMRPLRELVKNSALPELMKAGIQISYPDGMSENAKPRIFYNGHFDAGQMFKAGCSQIYPDFCPKAYRAGDIPWFVQAQLPLAGYALSTMVGYVNDYILQGFKAWRVKPSRTILSDLNDYVRSWL